jgi:hypothetical protein
MPQFLGVFLALIRHYVSDQVINVIKQAALDALAHGDWKPGDRTQFVIDEARKAVEATATPIDDILLEFAVKLYLKKYATKGN